MPEIKETEDQNSKIQSRLQEDDANNVWIEPNDVANKLAAQLGDQEADVKKALADAQKVEQPKPTKIRTRTVKPSTGKVDAQELIKRLTNQAAMVMWVETVQVPDILESVQTKAERDVMIVFQKALETAKQEAIKAITEL